MKPTTTAAEVIVSRKAWCVGHGVSLGKAKSALFFLIFAASQQGCVSNHTQSHHHSANDVMQDMQYLLENLDDGKLAMWQDRQGVSHRFAVFSSYGNEQGQVCRDYFHIHFRHQPTNEREYGTSCRIGHQQWQYMENSAQTAKSHYDEFMHYEQGIHSKNSRETSFNTPKNIQYTTRYQLSPFLLKTVRKAELEYNLQLRILIEQAAKTQDFHPCLIHALTYYESSYNPNAASGCCVGLMQLGKAAAQETGVNNRRNPEQNLAGGTKYLRTQLKQRGIEGQISLALAAYNCGYGTIKKNNFQIPERCWSNKTRIYVKKILNRFQQCQ